MELLQKHPKSTGANRHQQEASSLAYTRLSKTPIIKTDHIFKPSGLVALLLLISPSISMAFWGPKNFDECILQNIKGVTSDSAIGLIYETCESKFPSADQLKAKREALALEQRYKNCGLDQGNEKKEVYFHRDSFLNQPRKNETINNHLYKIKIIKLSSQNQLSVLNENDFTLGGIAFELKDNQDCRSNPNKVAPITYCNGSAHTKQYGEFYCQKIQVNHPQYYCLIGYSLDPSSGENVLLKYAEKNSLCPKK